VVGLGAVPAHGMARPRDDGDLDVRVAELGQVLSGEGPDDDLVVLASGDQERWPGDGCRHIDPRCLPNDLLRVSQGRVQLAL
jgi:hypothetical protein